MLNFPTEVEANWGCKASCEGLQSLVDETYPNNVCRYHPMHFNLPKAPVPRDPALFDDYIEYLASIRWEEYPDLSWADVVILDGEGSIHEFEDPGVNDFIYLKLLGIYAAKVKYGKKTMIVNHTLDFSTPEFEAFVSTVYPTCDYISVREAKSKQLLDGMGIKSTLTADTAFVYPKDDSVTADYSFSAEIPGRYYVFFVAQLVDVDSSYFVDLCSEIWRTFKLPAVFFILSEREKRVLDQVKSLGVPCVIIDEFVEPAYILETLGGAEFCLSGRFHMAIFSAMTNTPFVGFRSNTPKIAGLIEMLRYPIPEMVFGSTGSDEIVYAIQQIIDNRGKIKKDLERNVAVAKELARTTNIKAL